MKNQVCACLIAALSVCLTVRSQQPGRSGTLSQVDDVTLPPGMSDGRTVEVTTDGFDVFASAQNGGLVQYRRNSFTGELTQQEVFNTATHPDLNDIRAFSLSKDGKHLYAADYDTGALFTFSRNFATGDVNLIDAKVDGVSGFDGIESCWELVVSFDGRNVYLVSEEGDGSVEVFSRNVDTGLLSHLQSIPSAATAPEPVSIAVTEDNRSVIVGGRFGTAPDTASIRVFNRNTNGSLSLTHSYTPSNTSALVGSNAMWSIEVTQDFSFVYVLGLNTDSLYAFKRTPATGALSFIEVYTNGGSAGGVSISGMETPFRLTIPRDDTQVYVAAQNSDAIVRFQRDLITGELTFLGATDPSEFPGLDEVLDLDIAPDGRFIYAISWTFTPVLTHMQREWRDAVPHDYNGDGISDTAVFKPSTGQWKIRSMTGATIVDGLVWGDSSMFPVPGDYNGDGIYDLALYQPSTGNWYIRHVQDGRPPLAFGFQWGGPNLTPVAGDFNGDGAADFAVYENGFWYIRTPRLGAPPLLFGQEWGDAGSFPVD